MMPIQDDTAGIATLMNIVVSFLIGTGVWYYANAAMKLLDIENAYVKAGLWIFAGFAMMLIAITNVHLYCRP